MIYILVDWIHDHVDEPILILSEIDDNRNEVRKIEIFRDGKIGYAFGEIEVGGTGLSECPFPSIEEIASDPQFKPVKITKEEFEKVWKENVIPRIKPSKIGGFQNLLADLHWYAQQDIQERAMKTLELLDDAQLEILLQPIDKPYWDKAAEVIQRIGYPRVKNIMPGIFRWLQDMNWPGAQTIHDFLLSMDVGDLIPHLEKALIEADNTNDNVWIYWLKEFIRAKRLTGRDFNRPELLCILEKADSNEEDKGFI